MEVGVQDVQGFTLLSQPAPKQSYAPMARKPTPSSHEPPCQWNQVPVTLIYQWKNERGRDGGKRMIQRLNIPPTLLAQIMKKQRFAQKPRVAKDNKDRKLLDRTAKNSENQSHVNRMIQRLNKESGCQENVVLSTWRWCKQGWLSLSQMTDCWPPCTPCC